MDKKREEEEDKYIFRILHHRAHWPKERPDWLNPHAVEASPHTWC